MKLQGIRKCSINGHKVKDLYQMILNAPDLWEQAYGNIYANKGGMTPGVDRQTIDGHSDERAENLRQLLRENRYVPTPAQRVYIPKPNGKLRPLGMPTANDKLVQEVWRMILESIYEPVFHDTSHGFRPKRSCHTALKKIAYWAGTKWFIEFDIEGYFDNIDHTVLMGLLAKKIDDEKFLSVIKKMTKAGYMENWKYHGSYSGTPQGGIISPILANIYLHELDCYVAKLCSDFERGKKRADNPAYVWDNNRKAGLNKKIERETNTDIRNDLLNQKKELQRHMRTIPSANQYDGKYRRLRYCRYADDFVLSAICPKEEAEEIYKKIETFLKEELMLNTSKTKSGLKHNTEVIRFLGYDITVKNTDRTVKVTTKDGQHYTKRSLVGQIDLRIPEEKVKNFSDKKGYGNWITRQAMQRGLLINVSDAEITLCYSAELRGIAQYYALASNFSHAMGKLRILWIQSYLKTMANKHKMSVQQVATMLNRGSYMAVREKGKTGKVREIKLFKPKDVKREAIFDNKVDTPPLTLKYTGGSELLRRKNANKCEYCEKQGGYFEIHHVKKLANIKKGTQTWQRLMIARKRKTLVLCVECHDKLHAGTLPDVRQVLM
jgi:group II intron reverse transcriptase/maturase